MMNILTEYNYNGLTLKKVSDEIEETIRVGDIAEFRKIVKSAKDDELSYLHSAPIKYRMYNFCDLAFKEMQKRGLVEKF